MNRPGTGTKPASLGEQPAELAPRVPGGQSLEAHRAVKLGEFSAALLEKQQVVAVPRRGAPQELGDGHLHRRRRRQVTAADDAAATTLARG